MKKTVVRTEEEIRGPKPAPLRAVLFIIFTAALVALDRWSKYWVLAHDGLQNGESIEIIPGFFYFTYTFNKGAAWSFLADKSWGIYVLTGISAIAAVLFLIFLIKRSGWPFLMPFSLSLILAGTVGNLIDRFFLQGVVDFLDFHFGSRHFPTFNVADSLIVVGIILLIIMLIFVEPKFMKRWTIEQKHKVRPI